MPDGRVVRVTEVFGVLGFVVFVLAGFATTPTNSGTTQWFVSGGAALAVLCGLVIGLIWALKGGTDAAE